MITLISLWIFVLVVIAVFAQDIDISRLKPKKIERAKPVVELTVREVRDKLFQEEWIALAEWESDNETWPAGGGPTFLDLYHDFPNLRAAVQSRPELFGDPIMPEGEGPYTIYMRGEALVFNPPIVKNDKDAFTKRLNLMIAAGESRESIKAFATEHDILWEIMGPAVDRALDNPTVRNGLTYVLPHWKHENAYVYR